MCAESIPLEATVCEFCGTEFQVSIIGYCANCHQVREADEHGCCKVCNNEILDLRVESRPIKESGEPAATSFEEPQSSIRPAAQTRKFGWIWIPAGIIVFGLIVTAIGFAPHLSAIAVPSTSTATATVVPTITSTRTPRPTATATPMPAWVTDFAQPILSAIANRPPTIEDDLHDNSGGWHSNFYRTDYLWPIKFINGELVLSNCDAYRSKMGFKDFVLEVDGRFLSGTEGNAVLDISFRDQGPANPTYGVRVTHGGFLDISMYDESFAQNLRVNGEFQNNHILLIARGSKFALYVNGQPLYHWEDTEIGQAGYIYFRASGDKDDERSIVAIDNLKIWDLERVPNLP